MLRLRSSPLVRTASTAAGASPGVAARTPQRAFSIRRWVVGRGGEAASTGLAAAVAASPTVPVPEAASIDFYEENMSRQMAGLDAAASPGHADDDDDPYLHGSLHPRFSHLHPTQVRSRGGGTLSHPVARARPPLPWSALVADGTAGPAASPLHGAGSPTGMPNDHLEYLTARAYIERPIVGLGVHHFASGRFTRQLSEDEYVIDMVDVHLSPIVEVSSRVHVVVGNSERSEGRIAGGIVAKVNSDGTIGVLLDDNKFMKRVPQGQIALVEGRSRFTLEREYLDMMEWLRDAGLRRHADRERVCSMLYQRGWREGQLYLLEPSDLLCMTYIRKSSLLVVLEKAEWQRMHHAEMRGLLRERVKEREWRYFIQKFSGFVSANWAGLGVLSVFLWNFKNYRKQQRAYQMKYAVKALTSPNATYRALDERRQFVRRTSEENWARQILRQLNIARPRVAVLTGMAGCGKSTLFRSAIRKENKPAVFVEVRGREDALACVLKALKVPSPDACGDYLDFISDAFTRASKINGEPPIVVVTLREGSELSRVYNETVVLSCDRMLCHLVFEVALETLTVSNTALPRVDFYHVPNFSFRQAMEYTQHSVDAVSMREFIEVVGTNSNDIDELFAAVHHHKIPITQYTLNKLAKAMRQVQAAWSTTPEDYHRAGGRRHNHHNSVHSPTVGTTSGSGGAASEDNLGVKAALKKLAEADYATGVHSGMDVAVLRHPALREIVLYDPVQDRWIFMHKVLHTAVRCCL